MQSVSHSYSLIVVSAVKQTDSPPRKEKDKVQIKLLGDSEDVA